MQPYYDHDGITIYNADNVAVLATFAGDCIDLVVTSPPYDDLRKYGGYSWDFEGVAQQLWRVMKPGGVVVWIVADQTIDGSETGTSFRQALRFKEIGFRLHDTMIYERQAQNPSNTHGRYWQNFEYMFILSKGELRCANLLRDKPNTQRKMGSGFSRARNGDMKGNHARSQLQFEKYGYRSNVWTIHKTGGGNMGDGVGSHPAVFPESLCRDHILSWSNPGDTVLDPCNGSGTTTKMAKDTERKAIGIDIEERYCEIAAKRLRQGVLSFEPSEL